MSELSDLEITRLCAEAMGDIASELPDFPGELYLRQPNDELYNPLNDDAQATALMKKFKLSVGFSGGWGCVKNDERGMLLSGAYHFDSLNRAVCTCVAEMQRSRK